MQTREAEAWVVPNSSVKPPSASIPPPYAGGCRGTALTSLPEADALTAGPPLAHAQGTPTAAKSRWVPNRPAASRRLLPLHRGVRFSKPTAPHRGPSSEPTTYLSPASRPRAAKRTARRLVRRAPGRELQRFLSGARLASCSLGRCLITQRRREMTIGL